MRRESLAELDEWRETVRCEGETRRLVGRGVSSRRNRAPPTPNQFLSAVGTCRIPLPRSLSQEFIDTLSPGTGSGQPAGVLSNFCFTAYFLTPPKNSRSSMIAVYPSAPQRVSASTTTACLQFLACQCLSGTVLGVLLEALFGRHFFVLPALFGKYLEPPGHYARECELCQALQNLGLSTSRAS
ncbi:hypothetical protein BDY21DRAFT_46753 [Lineolata rhizophorae]|uniref:Uncharacterized protein n=1 Tax=Lineolata rhizophorae TaxID=578093 RepID=A0A6A6NYV2_9PEZI|nr:hypothetical protein BDY21DRAFT_46753 [Lineolata rhizophorae]